MSTTQNELTQAPSDLREQFHEWLDSYEPDRLKEIDIRPVASMLDALSTCGDVLPADYCDQLEIPEGSTYWEAVADVRQFHAERTGESETPVVYRRLYTCCPDAGCTAFQEGLSFLHSFGIEPEMDVDDDGHHYFGFSLPRDWSLGRRREFNEALAERVSSDAQPCEFCGNVQYSRAHLDTCEDCGRRFVICEECLLDDVDPGDCPE